MNEADSAASGPASQYMRESSPYQLKAASSELPDGTPDDADYKPKVHNYHVRAKTVVALDKSGACLKHAVEDVCETDVSCDKSSPSSTPTTDNALKSEHPGTSGSLVTDANADMCDLSTSLPPGGLSDPPSDVVRKSSLPISLQPTSGKLHECSPTQIDPSQRRGGTQHPSISVTGNTGIAPPGGSYGQNLTLTWEDHCHSVSESWNAGNHKRFRNLLPDEDSIPRESGVPEAAERGRSETCIFNMFVWKYMGKCKQRGLRQLMKLHQIELAETLDAEDEEACIISITSTSCEGTTKAKKALSDLYEQVASFTKLQTFNLSSAAEAADDDVMEMVLLEVEMMYPNVVVVCSDGEVVIAGAGEEPARASRDLQTLLGLKPPDCLPLVQKKSATGTATRACVEDQSKPYRLHLCCSACCCSSLNECISESSRPELIITRQPTGSATTESTPIAPPKHVSAYGAISSSETHH